MAAFLGSPLLPSWIMWEPICSYNHTHVLMCFSIVNISNSPAHSCAYIQPCRPHDESWKCTLQMQSGWRMRPYSIPRNWEWIMALGELLVQIFYLQCKQQHGQWQHLIFATNIRTTDPCPITRTSHPSPPLSGDICSSSVAYHIARHPIPKCD